MSSFCSRFFWLSALVIGLDQLTKQIADNVLVYRQPDQVFPGFNLTLVYNEGAAFSFLSDAGGWQRWFFTIIAIVISLVIIVWMTRVEPAKRFLIIGLALILGGAIGNLIDRVLFGHVIDFIQVYYDVYYFPAFNIADSAISLGAVCLIIDMIQEARQGEVADGS